MKKSWSELQIPALIIIYIIIIITILYCTQ